MGLGDFIRSLFARRGSPALEELETFAADRKGLEGFIEPRTPTSPTSLLLVDRHGEHLRAPLREPEDAVDFCRRQGIPVYDARVVGYPRRMKEYQRRLRSGSLEDLDESIAELEKRLGESPPEETDRED